MNREIALENFMKKETILESYIEIQETFFEENFFSQFKNLIDPREKLNNQAVKTILEELDSYLNEYFEMQVLEEEKNKEKQQAQKREVEYLETHRTETDEEGNILPVPTGYHSWYSHEE